MLKRTVLGVTSLIVVAFAFVYALSSRRMGMRYDVDVVDITTSADSATLALGKRVADTRGCTDCHRPDLGGRTFIDGMPVMRMTASNLTSGSNGVAAEYTDADWVRAVRSGVRPDGSALLFMPSYEYRALGPDDLGALVSWIKSVPRVDTEPLDQAVGPLGRVLFLAGRLPLIPAELIDHSDPTFSQPEAGLSEEFGAYVATACLGCHGPGFSGGVVPGFPPDWPEAANLTPDVETGIGSWSEDDFFSFFDDGVRPDGRQIDAAYMPWTTGQSLSGEEKSAL
jgi:mono/diheme cytochrome c family protein